MLDWEITRLRKKGRIPITYFSIEKNQMTHERNTENMFPAEDLVLLGANLMPLYYLSRRVGTYCRSRYFKAENRKGVNSQHQLI